MSKVLFMKKGYHVIVDSWENDGDYNQTKTMIVGDKDLALSLKVLCKKMFTSKNKDPYSIGNSDGMNEELMPYLARFMQDFPTDAQNIFGNVDIDMVKKIIDQDADDDMLEAFNKYYDKLSDIAYNLMDTSEYYTFRVCENVKILYCDQDIYLEKIA